MHVYLGDVVRLMRKDPSVDFWMQYQMAVCIDHPRLTLLPVPVRSGPSN